MNIFELNMLITLLLSKSQEFYFTQRMTDELDEFGTIINTTINVIPYVPRYLRSHELDFGKVLIDGEIDQDKERADNLKKEVADKNEKLIKNIK